MERAHVHQSVEKRQFGRRRSDIRGSAIGKDQPKPFTIHDLSEGGARLVFDDPAYVPERSLRIQIDGTKMTLLCEVRHNGRSGVGVRFMRPSEGSELNRYFLTKPVDVAADTASEIPRRAHPPAAVVRGQDLRASLHLVHPAAEIEPEARGQEIQREVKRSALASGLLRVRRVLTSLPKKPQSNAAKAVKDAGHAQPRR